MPSLDGVAQPPPCSPAIMAVATTRISPWVELVARTLATSSDGPRETFHSLRQADYVTVLAVTADERFVVVSQYRPALERSVLELPGGLLDDGESPVAAVLRELHEETGFKADEASLEPLGRLDPDSGRLENALWPFFVRDVEFDPSWTPEAGVTPSCLTVDELVHAVRTGGLTHALHLGVLGAALLRGLLPELAAAMASQDR